MKIAIALHCVDSTVKFFLVGLGKFYNFVLSNPKHEYLHWQGVMRRET